MKHFTAKQVAEFLQVTVNHVYGLIRSGHLEATNVKPSAIRPTWRISQDQLEAFDRRHSNAPGITPREKKRGITKGDVVKQYFT